MSRRTSAMLSRLFVLAVTLLLAEGAMAAGAPQTCEKAVVAECIKTTCPAFCASRPKAQRAACKTQCTAKQRCKLSLSRGRDRSSNQVLAIQTRDQLMACVREKRGDSSAAERPKRLRHKTTTKARTGKTGKKFRRQTMVAKRHSDQWKKRRTRSFIHRSAKPISSKPAAKPRKWKRRGKPMPYKGEATGKAKPNKKPSGLSKGSKGAKPSRLGKRPKRAEPKRMGKPRKKATPKRTGKPRKKATPKRKGKPRKKATPKRIRKLRKKTRPER